MTLARGRAGSGGIGFGGVARRGAVVQPASTTSRQTRIRGVVNTRPLWREIRNAKGETLNEVDDGRVAGQGQRRHRLALQMLVEEPTE